MVRRASATPVNNPLLEGKYFYLEEGYKLDIDKVLQKLATNSLYYSTKSVLTSNSIPGLSLPENIRANLSSPGLILRLSEPGNVVLDITKIRNFGELYNANNLEDFLQEDLCELLRNSAWIYLSNEDESGVIFTADEHELLLSYSIIDKPELKPLLVQKVNHILIEAQEGNEDEDQDTTIY